MNLKNAQKQYFMLITHILYVLYCQTLFYERCVCFKKVYIDLALFV